MRRSDLFFSAILLSGLFTVAACGSGDQKITFDGAVGQSLTISSVSPNQGPQGGGTTIIIAGENLEDMTGMVLVGDNLASNVMVLEDGSISAEVPANVGAGPVDVTVFSSSGYGVLGDAFSYNPSPTITDVQPRIGASGDTITITGTGFAEFNPGATSIKLGDSDCAAAMVVNDTTVTCTAGQAAAAYEANEVRLRNDNGDASFNSFAFNGVGLMVFVGRNSPEANQVYFIDPLAAEPAFIRVGQTDQPLHSPVRLANGDYIARGLNQNESNLLSLNIDTLKTTPLTPVAAGPKITDMATNGAQLVALRQFSNDNTPFLFILNPVTGAETPISVTLIPEVRNRQHGLVNVGTNSFLLATRTNGPVIRVVKNITNTASASIAFTANNPDNENIRDLVSLNGRIFGIRRGGSGLTPPPGGSNGGGGTLIEIDPVANTITDIASSSAELHSLVEVQ